MAIPRQINTKYSSVIIEDYENNPSVNIVKSKRKSDISNTIETTKTTITTSPTRILTPENSTDFIIFHKTDAILSVGDESVDVNDYVELEIGECLEVSDMKKNDANEIYGIVASGTLDVYVIGVIKI